MRRPIPGELSACSVAPLAAIALGSPCASPRCAAPVPKEQLLKPPADAVHYVVVSEAGKHGDQWRWTLPDGRIAYRYSQSLRGWITETDQVTTLGRRRPAGRDRRFAASRRTAMPPRPSDVRTARRSGKHRRQRRATAATGYLSARRRRRPRQPCRWSTSWSRPGPTGIDLLPERPCHAGDRAEPVQIKGPSGPKTVQLAFVRGILPSPIPDLARRRTSKYFADVGCISTHAGGYEAQRQGDARLQEATTAEAGHGDRAAAS